MGRETGRIMLVPVPQPLLSQPPANVIACGMIALLINRLLGTGCKMLDGLMIDMSAVASASLRQPYILSVACTAVWYH